MNYRTLAAFGLSIGLMTAPARARDRDAEPDKATGTSEAGGARGKTADETSEDEEDTEVDSSAKAKAKAADDHETVGPAMSAMEIGPRPERPPVYGKRGDWFIVPYGYARLDAIEDSTQSFADGIQPNLIARVGTYKGDHPRSTFTAKDSRLGVFVGAPTFAGIRSSAQIELDFYGLEPTDARANDTIIFATPRIRHAFLKFETPIFDVVAGQTYDLFGFGPYFYPATVAYLGVPGQIYHRDPELRIEKKLHLGNFEVTAAIAAVKAGERDSGIPDGQAGIKLNFNGWRGAATPGFSRPVLAPLSIGVSGLYRHFSVPPFVVSPGSETVTTDGYGLAVSLLLPIIPIKSIEDHGNALTLTGEFSTGAGIADMYTGMDGGSRFPLLPVPSGQPTIYYYQADADPGLVTFDKASDLKTIKWNAAVANLQYYLPIGWGRVWLSGTYSRTWSPNIKALTPPGSLGVIFTKMEYVDGNVGFELTPSIVCALSFQTVAQTFGDVTAPTPTYVQSPNSGVVPGVPGTGGAAVSARNNRGQLSVALFF
jgi:hypothetical protein